jgi:hypothetical protein
MNPYSITMVDGRRVQFHPEPIGEGAEKVAFFTTDRKQVLCFFMAGLKDRQLRRARLDRILARYNPTTGPQGAYWETHFRWPTGLLDGGRDLPAEFLRRYRLQDPPLATLAPIYPQNFFFVDRTGSKREKNGKWFTSPKCRVVLPPNERGNFLGYLRVCTKMARGVTKMHFSGLAHSDLSNRNVLIDPRNGDACIIDIDSLVVPGIAPPTVLGTPGYIAPEVRAGKSLPCIETDRHALAVLIYETLLMRHPLAGPKVRSTRSPEEDDYLSMGPQALFVEHPGDRSNALRPPPAVTCAHLGPYLEALFRRVFIDGLHAPGKRPGADEWERALYLTFDLLHPTPDGTDWCLVVPDRPVMDPVSRRRFSDPIPFAQLYVPTLQANEYVAENRSLVIYHHLALMPWHTTVRVTPGPQTDTTRHGYFARHNGKWLLVNEAEHPFRIVGGRTIYRGDAVEIVPDLQLSVGPPGSGKVLLFNFLK